ncbi:MAG: restriction endonuclease subunit S [Gammaproteobacteria bacterium]|nr:restriction endonuclease subunit S [Gammaproteobacteria bacterium]
MSGWPLLALGEVFDIARGGSPRPIDEFITEDPAGINWIMIGDASEGSKYITGTKKRIRPEGAQRSRAVKPGDFLLTNSMSFGKPYIMRTSGCIHDGWLVLSPRRRDVDADFFYHLLGSNAVYSEFERRAAGATVKNLNIDLVRGVKVPLPPLPKQRRIAEILDKADALRAKRRAALAQLDTLTQSIFLDMFGDPATNAKGWPKASLEELFEIARGGSPRPIDDYITDDPHGINWIMIGDTVEGGKYITSAKKRIRPEGARRSRAVKPGDFLLTNSMSFGRPYIMRTSGCIHDGWLVLSPRREDVEPNYFYALLGTRAVYAEFARRAPGATVKNLNIDLVRGVTVPVPPLPAQEKFAAVVASIEGRALAYSRSLAECDALFAALQYRAFGGDL